MNNRCDEIKKDLMAYFDGELSSQKISEVEKHLNECEICQKEFQQFQNTKNLLHTNPVPKHSQEYWNDLKRRIVNQYYSITTPEKEHKNIFQFLSTKPAFWLACLLVLFLIIFLFKSKENSSNLLVAHYPWRKTNFHSET